MNFSAIVNVCSEGESLLGKRECFDKSNEKELKFKFTNLELKLLASIDADLTIFFTLKH